MDPISQNIQGVQQLVGSTMNKILGGLPAPEGVFGQFKDELELSLSDEELLRSKDKIEKEYAGDEAKIKLRQQANLTYYLGKQKGGSPEAMNGQSISDNIIFEAVETFVPASLAKNPEPVVFSDDTPEGDALSTQVKTMLQYHAEILGMRANLNLMVRKWLMDFSAVIKHGWDTEIQDITDDVRDVKNFIFDRNGYVDVYGAYTGTLGERIKSTAQELIDLFPKHEDYIRIMVDNKLGTEVIRTEWWSDKFTFTSFKEKILDKSKNPNYNYDKKVKSTDIDGNESEETEKGNNHFGRPKKPYTFMSVFSFGEGAHDVTGLVEQNIPNQVRVSKRTAQIDFNLSARNNSVALSENNFNQETGKQFMRGLASGNGLLVPQGGPIEESMKVLEMPGVDSSYFDDLENQKTALRMSFGTEGLTASPPDKNELATGIIANEQHDGSRIGGGVGDALERVAKAIFNQHVQFYYVYYDVPHEAKIMGQMQAVQYSQLSSAQMNKGLVVTVSPDSMKPRDEISEMNQAMSLYEAKALDPKTLLTRVHFPDPQDTAEQTVLWLTSPETYMQLNFPEVAAKVQQMQQQMMQQEQQAQQQQMQSQAQGEQQNQQLQGQAAQQQMQVKGQQAQQDMQIKQQTHEQKLKQAEESHKAKLEAQKKSEANKPKTTNKK